MEQVEKFDPSKLMDGVRDRIKATFVSLIPDDQWEQMCNAEMKKFFEPSFKGYNNSEKVPSQFEQIVRQMMEEKLKEYLKDLFNKPEYSITTIWTNSGQEYSISEHLDNMIKEKMPDMLQAFMAKFMADAFQNFFYQAQQSLQRF